MQLTAQEFYSCCKVRPSDGGGTYKCFHGSLKLNLPTNKILQSNMEKLHSHFSTSFTAAATAACIQLLCSKRRLCSPFGDGKYEIQINFPANIIRRHLVRHSPVFPLRKGTVLWISGIERMTNCNLYPPTSSSCREQQTHTHTKHNHESIRRGNKFDDVINGPIRNLGANC